MASTRAQTADCRAPASLSKTWKDARELAKLTRRLEGYCMHNYTHISDDGQVEEVSDERDLSQEVENDGEEVTDGIERNV
jgi:hypothetical protein